MKVWLVNLFYNLPAEGYPPQRYWQMAEAFADSGCEVTYFTSSFSHANKAPRRFLPPERTGVPRRFRGADSPIRVVALAAPPYRRNIGLRRVWSHLRTALDFRRASAGWAREHGRPDLVVAATPPLSLALAAMDRAHGLGAKFVADVNDAWPETFYRLLPRWTLGWMRRMARRLYCGADAVVAVSERYLDLARGYGAKSPMHVAYHSA